ncbi:phosphonatase-like hydrolase [Dyadobacter sp. SG02]|uniref:HAD family hydrolase n=1 Tax=Dyadobacter sp. SG02 TaxID=1855291 RepID=UPI0008AD5F19|nr:HAD family hydrolase [Dyadobacter sp. SG02]SEJ38542.1 phosphonatase-like hydrolase [Dyadobacter sp. SG02]
MIKMIVFDMAGTTVDENNVVYKTLLAAINDAGLSFTLDQVLQVGAGKEKLEAIRSVMSLQNIINEPLAREIYVNFLSMLDDAYRSQAIFEQPNASAVFRKLRENNVIVVLNTGYNRATAEALILKIGWRQGVDYDLLVTASEVTRNRPEPDMILLAMQHFGITDPASVMKVGDSTVDVLEGRNAGCRINVGITTGAHSLEELKTVSPEYIISNLNELWEIVAVESVIEPA